MRITKGDVRWNYIGTFLSLCSNFLLLPFITYFLNGEEIGLWYVFLSIGGIITLFDFGFNPTFSRNVAYSWSGATELSKTGALFVKGSKPNIKLLKKVILTSKRLYLIISLIALAVLLTIGTYYILYVSDGISGYNHIIAWFIYSIAVFLNLYYGYYTTFLRGVGAIKQVNIATVLSRVVQILLSIILLFWGFGLIAVATAYLVYGLLFRIISKILFYRYENIGELIDQNGDIIKANDIKSTFVTVWHNAWRDGLVSLSRYLSSQATVIIASFYLSLTSTGVYSISIQFIAAISTISGALYTSYQPSLQSAYINKNVALTKKLMSLSMVVFSLLYWIAVIVLIVIGIPIFNLIMPDTDFSIPILLAIALYEFLLKHHSLYASFIANTNQVPYMKSFIISSFACVIFATLLVKGTGLGVWGLILAPIIVQGSYNNWIWPYKVMKSLKTNPVEMFKIAKQEFSMHFQKKTNAKLKPD